MRLRIIPGVAWEVLKWLHKSSEIALEGLGPHSQDSRYPPRALRGTSGDPPEAPEGLRRHPQDARYPPEAP